MKLGGEGTLNVEVPNVARLLNTWQERRRMEYLRNPDNVALDVFRRRAGVIGYRAGVIAYLLSDLTETPQVLNFALWVAEYTLKNQLELFGDAINNLRPADVQKRTCNTALFDLLPPEFGIADVAKQRAKEGLSTDAARMICSRWLARGLTEKIARGLYRKIKR